MSAIDRFWLEMGFNPHPSNKTHYWAGFAVGVVFFFSCYFHFYRYNFDRLLISSIITFLAGVFFASIKEWSDYSQRKELAWKKWDWLDWLYTIFGAMTIPCIAGLITLITYLFK